MKYSKSVILILLLLTPIYSQEYQLVWADEFEGSVLDTAKWEYMTGDGSAYGLPGWGNKELQCYRRENVSLKDGKLLLTAKDEKFSTCNYTSARIRTRGKAFWKYGRFEARIKLPFGRGLWPAVWLLPEINEYGGWASSGEIDIMEYIGNEPNKVHGTIHYGGKWPENKQSGAPYILADADFNEDFHTFALEWEEGRLSWFVDDSLYQTQTSWWSSAKEFPAPFDREFYFILNLAVGGEWPGAPDQNTTFPQIVMVDYLRVYQKK